MLLDIVKPSSKNSFDIVWLDIQTPVGNFVIAKKHAPTIITLSDFSTVTYLLTNNKLESIEIQKGIVHITRDSITLLINEI